MSTFENISRFSTCCEKYVDSFHGKKLNLEIPLEKNKLKYEKREKNNDFLAEKNKGFSKQIENAFSHFELNQSSKKRCDNIINNYCPGGTLPSYLENHGFLIPNKDDESIDRFVESIVKWNKHYSKITSKSNVKDKFRFLIGPKGCGKTTFLNYILTREHLRLNDEKIIAVRINALDLPLQNDIQKALKAKKCKVLLNWYKKDNKNGFEFDFEFEEMFQVLKKIDPAKYRDNKEELKLNFKNFLAKFSASANADKAPVFEENFYMSYEALKKYIFYKEPNLSFLYILDNFDKLGLGKSSQVEYENAIKELNTLMTNDDKNGGTYIIVCRYVTYLKIKKLTNKNTFFYSLVLPDLKSIIQKRIKNFANESKELFETYIRLVGSGISYHEERDNEFPLQSLDESINNLYRFANEDRRIIIDILKDYKNDFIRERDLDSFMNFLYNLVSKENQYKEELVYEKTLPSKIEWTSFPYRENLLIDANGWAESFYYYEFKNSKRKKIIHADESNSSQKFEILPNLYTYPFIPETYNVTQCAPLIKIHIIQLFLRYKLKFGQDATLPEDAVINYFKYFFNYDKNILQLCIDELIFSEILRKGNLHGRGNGITISERGVFIFNNFAHRLNYICICFEAVALPTDILNSGKVNLLPIANYYDSYRFFMHNKVLGSAKFIGILSGIERKQQLFYLNQEKDYTYDEKRSPLEGFHEMEDFYFIRIKVKENVEEGWNDIIEYFKTKKKSFENEINDYVNDYISNYLG